MIREMTLGQYYKAFLILIVKLSKVPVSMMIRGVKPLFIIICFSAIINMISVSGDMLVKIGPITIAKQGLWMAFYLVVRLVYLVIGSSVMTFTTTPNQLTDGLEKGFHFLKKVHVPVHEIAMMMSIALRFIPILTEELDKIMKAQMDARCYNGGEGKTRLHPLIYEKRDYIAYGIMLLYVVIMIFCSFILKRFF